MAGFPVVEVKVAPGGKLRAVNEIAPATPGFDALTVKVSIEPTVALSAPGTTRKVGGMEVLATVMTTEIVTT